MMSEWREIIRFEWRQLALAVLATAAALAASQLLADTGIGLTLAPALVALIYSGAVGGLVPALVSAVMIGIYSHIVLSQDLGRAIIINSSYLGGALLLGWLESRARMADRINGNIARLKSALNITDGLIDDWRILTDEQRFEQIVLIRHHLAHLATIIAGWRVIRREIVDTKAKVKKKGFGND